MLLLDLGPGHVDWSVVVEAIDSVMATSRHLANSLGTASSTPAAPSLSPLSASPADAATATTLHLSPPSPSIAGAIPSPEPGQPAGSRRTARRSTHDGGRRGAASSSVYQDFTEWLWALQTPLSPDLVDAVRQSPVWVRAQVQPWVIVSPLVDRDRQASAEHGRLPTLRGATLVVRTPLVWLSTKPALPTGPSRHPSPDQDGVGAVGDDGEEEEDEAAVGFACFFFKSSCMPRCTHTHRLPPMWALIPFAPSCHLHAHRCVFTRALTSKWRSRMP